MQEIKELRDARVFEQYDEANIKLRVTNGDGAKMKIKKNIILFQEEDKKTERAYKKQH